MDIEILDMEGVCQLLKVSESTIRHYIRNYGLPYNQIKKHTKITFDKNKLIKWWSRFNHPYEKFLRRSGWTR